MKKTYDVHTPLDFGMYKGYDLGVVYVFDPRYIEWCILNIDKFCVENIEGLQDLGIINSNLNWQYRMIGDPIIIPHIDVFESFEDLLLHVNLSDKEKYIFSDELIEKNKEKLRLALGYPCP